jgi:alanyl-tRNA synthetase
VIDQSKKTSQKISGSDAFKLKDTYGFPLEEVLLIAKDEGLHVDTAAFEKLEQEAKEKSRKAHQTVSQQFDANFFGDFTKTHKPCLFDGYQKASEESKVIGIVVDGHFTDKIQEGQEGLLILDRTPFYAEMGGQIGDSGQLKRNSHLFTVTETKSPFPGVIAHFGSMTQGSLQKNDAVTATINQERRVEIQNHHTATHLLHWALHQVLGSHIKQAGSLVEESRLRFDFSHHKPLSPSELRSIEDLVNKKIREDVAVNAYEIPFEKAQKQPEIKQFFGEKYGDIVRVIDIDFSKELCGGTHTNRLGTIGLFKISKESSIAAGVRRIEAVTGKYAEKLVQQEEDTLQHLSTTLKTTPAGLVEKLNQLLEEQKTLNLELKARRKESRKGTFEACLKAKESVGHCALIAQIVDIEAEELVPFADELLQRLGSGIVLLGIQAPDKCQLLIAVSPDLVAKNVLASKLIKEVAPLIQGGGGGKPNLAQAGGKNGAGLKEAFDHIRQLLKSC